MGYWRREALAYQSGMLADLPDFVRAPGCYGVSEQADGAWIWLENIVEAAGPTWTLEHFQQAARHLGRFGRGLPGRSDRYLITPGCAHRCSAACMGRGVVGALYQPGFAQ